MPISYYFIIPILSIAVWSDWKSRIIPNKLLLPSTILSLSLNFWTMGLAGLRYTFLGIIVGLSLLIIPYLLGGMGAGDVKLMMVIGSFLGPEQSFVSFTVGALLGGIMAICAMMINKYKNMKCSSNASNNTSQIIASIPYGIPLSLGTMICIFLSYWR